MKLTKQDLLNEVKNKGFIEIKCIYKNFGCPAVISCRFSYCNPINGIITLTWTNLLKDSEKILKFLKFVIQGYRDEIN